MKITRINESTVNCIITADDMDEQGLTLEDILAQSESATLFLHEIIEKAAHEVDYKPHGGVMPMQLSVLPDKSVSITLSENPQTAVADMLRGLADRLQQFLTDVQKRATQDREESSFLDGEQYTESLSPSSVDKAQDENPGKEAHIDVRIGADDNPAQAFKKEKWQQIFRFKEYVFSFKEMHTLIRYAVSLKNVRAVASKLYKETETNTFHLYLVPGKDRAGFEAAVINAMEYGGHIVVNPNAILHILEKSEHLIEHGALEALRGI